MRPSGPRPRPAMATGLSSLAGALLMAAWLAPPAAAQQPRVSLELKPRGELGLEELATLEITFEIPGGRPPQLRPKFELDNLRIAGGPVQSTSLRILNGVQSSAVTLSWRLEALDLGPARVYGGSVQVGDEVVALPDRTLTVVANPPRRQARRVDPFGDPLFSEDPFDRLLRERGNRRGPERRPPPAPKVFLRAEASPARPFVGQQVVYTLYLYLSVNVQDVEPVALPDFKGFWSRSIPQPEPMRPRMVEYGGEELGRVILLQQALFPRRAGSFEIPPIEASMIAAVASRRVFGALLPRSRRISERSNPVTVEVRALPPAPEGFAGAVGALELTADLSPQQLDVGDAATLTLTLAGRGHLQGIAAPALPDMPGIEVFPPQQQSREEVRGQHVEGRRTWSYVLVPERAGDFTVPPIEIPFFDPQKERYRVAASTPLDLEIRGPVRADRNTGETIQLHPIRTAALPAVGADSGFLRAARPWLLGLPWAVGLIWLFAQRGAAGSHRQARQRLLRRLDGVAGEERPRQAAAAIEEGWRDYLLERWQIPPGEASTRWAEHLDASGVRPQVAAQLVELADDLHYLRYAPKLSSTDELRRELLERSRKLARSLG